VRLRLRDRTHRLEIGASKKEGGGRHACLEVQGDLPAILDA